MREPAISRGYPAKKTSIGLLFPRPFDCPHQIANTHGILKATRMEQGMTLGSWNSKNSLSVKLLRVVLLSALIVGVALSVAQIVFDAYKTRQAVASDAQRILDMFRDPSTQAVHSLDREMGMQVIEGLLQDDAVRMASIGHPTVKPCSRKKPRHAAIPSRWLTDLILGQERTFTTALVGKGPYSEYYGDLSITLDTATYGQGLRQRSSSFPCAARPGHGPGAVPGVPLAADQTVVADYRAPDVDQLDRPSEHKIPSAQRPRTQRTGAADQHRQSVARIHRTQYPPAPRS